MSIKHEFEYTKADGTPVISLVEWIHTLPANEIQEFKESMQRQFDTRQQCIDKGDLIVQDADDGTTYYVWKDEETERIGKKQDPIWMKYFNRYLEENNIQFNVRKTKI